MVRRRPLGEGTEAGHPRPAVRPLGSLSVDDGRPSFDRARDSAAMVAVRVGRGARRVRCVVYVLPVNVDGVGDESRAPVAVTGIPLLEAEEINPLLDSVQDVETHRDCVYLELRVRGRSGAELGGGDGRRVREWNSGSRVEAGVGIRV